MAQRPCDPLGLRSRLNAARGARLLTADSPFKEMPVTVGVWQ
jgi:hypothetical protein